MAPAWLTRLKVLDAYPKVNEDFFTRTLSGGVITIVSTLIMAFLFLSELGLYMSVKTVHELTVDTSRGEQIQIHMDVTLPRMPCAWISIDAMDISGEVQLDVDHDVYRTRLSEHGKPLDAGEKGHVGPLLEELPSDANATAHLAPDYCGSCYGAEQQQGQCCNTCDEVRRLYTMRGWVLKDLNEVEQCQREGVTAAINQHAGEGCRVWGTLLVNKVAGNIHIAPGKSYQQGAMHMHDLAPFSDTNFDFSHHIDKFGFGTEFPGIKNPLDGAKSYQRSKINPNNKPGMFQYYLKVVPTMYTDLRNKTIHTNQFSATQHFQAVDVVSMRSLPGVFFFYDLSPIKVRMYESRTSFLQFLTSVCAIVGGVFTVSGIVDAAVYHSDRLLRQKVEIGKFS